MLDNDQVSTSFWLLGPRDVTLSSPIDMMFGTGFKRSQVQTGVQWARARGKANGGLQIAFQVTVAEKNPTVVRHQTKKYNKVQRDNRVDA